MILIKGTINIMIIISILSIIVAISLQPVNNSLAGLSPAPATRDPISPILFARLSSIIFIYSAILNFNVLYIDNLESGIGIYNGYYQVTSISLSIEIFMYLIGALILMPWYPSTAARKEALNLELLEGKGALVGDIRMSYPDSVGHLKGAQFTTLLNSGLLKVPDIFKRSELTEKNYKSSSPILSEYSLILLFTTLGGSLLISSSDLISMYLSIELQSFAVYLLTSLNRDSETSTSAGLKYFLLGGLSSCLILLGCALVYSYTGITNLDSIYSLVSVPSVWMSDFSLGIDPLTNLSVDYIRGFLLGIVLIFIGFLFKIAGAPFHNWAPDVYDDSSTIVTTWLTIMPKISIIIFLLELESGLFIPFSSSLSSMHMESDITSILQIVKDLHSPLTLAYAGEGIFNSEMYYPSRTWEGVIKSLLLFSSLLSLIIGTVVGLAQYKIKRLLAYSTISHVGFLLLALGINTEQSIESLIFYILQYSITNLNTFLILLVFGYTFNTLLDQSYTQTPTHIQAKEQEQGDNKSSEYIFKKEKEESYVIQSNNMDIKYISQLKAQFIYNPILSISFAICLFSMAGIPPLLGFFAKQQVLYSATHSGYYFLSIVAILVSVISASYYLQIIKVIHFPSDKYFGLIKKGSEESSLPHTLGKSSPISLKANSDLELTTANSNDYLNILYGLKKMPSAIEGKLNTTDVSLNKNTYSQDNSQLDMEGIRSGKEIQPTNDLIQITNVQSMTISTLTLTILLFILNPSLILNSTHLLALTIFNS